MCHWWYHWYLVMLIQISSHDQKVCVSTHFHHLDLRNAVMPLTMPSTSLATNASMEGITWPKRSCCTLFQLSWPKECNGAIDNAVTIYDANAGATWWWCRQQWSHMTKKSFEPHFDHLNIRNAIAPLMTLSASYYPDANGKSQDQESLVTIHFDCHYIRNAVCH